MWPNPQETADLDTFTEEILNGKLHFLSGESVYSQGDKDFLQNSHFRVKKNLVVLGNISQIRYLDTTHKLEFELETHRHS